MPVRFLQPNTKTKKGGIKPPFFVLARAVGIEPTLEVLETPVLPLYDARKC